MTVTQSAPMAVVHPVWLKITGTATIPLLQVFVLLMQLQMMKVAQTVVPQAMAPLVQAEMLNFVTNESKVLLRSDRNDLQATNLIRILSE